MIKPVKVVDAYNYMKKYCLSATAAKTFPNGTCVKYGHYRDVGVVYKTVERKNGTLLTTFWHYLLGKEGKINCLDRVSTYERNELGSIEHSVIKSVKSITVKNNRTKFEGKTPINYLKQNADLKELSPKEKLQIEKIKEQVKAIRENSN